MEDGESIKVNQWRKYGMKVMKKRKLGENTEAVRCYYRCNFPGCKGKKQIDKVVDLDGKVLQKIPKESGEHCHPEGIFGNVVCYDDREDPDDGPTPLVQPRTQAHPQGLPALPEAPGVAAASTATLTSSKAAQATPTPSATTLMLQQLSQQFAQAAAASEMVPQGKPAQAASSDGRWPMLENVASMDRHVAHAEDASQRIASVVEAFANAQAELRPFLNPQMLQMLEPMLGVAHHQMPQQKRPLQGAAGETVEADSTQKATEVVD
jgi:hypothetical protein